MGVIWVVIWAATFKTMKTTTYLAIVDSCRVSTHVRTPINAVVLGSFPGLGDSTVSFLRVISISELHVSREIKRTCV